MVFHIILQIIVRIISFAVFLSCPTRKTSQCESALLFIQNGLFQAFRQWRVAQKAERRGKSGTPSLFFFPAHFSLHRPSLLSELRSNLYFNLSSEIPEQSPLLKDDKCTLSSSVHLSTLLPWPAVIEKKNTHSVT